MKERHPDLAGMPTRRPNQIARLRLAPNTVLFENLKPFYRRPETVIRVGQHGLFLYSTTSVPLVRQPQMLEQEQDSVNRDFDLTRANYVDSSLRRMSSSDKYLQIGENLLFQRTRAGGLAIRMNALLNDPAMNILASTPFIKHGRLLGVALVVPTDEHASGDELKPAAQHLQDTLRDTTARAGTDSIDLQIIHTV